MKKKPITPQQLREWADKWDNGITSEAPSWSTLARMHADLMVEAKTIFDVERVVEVSTHRYYRQLFK